jgi:heterodisulfide reductase subunit C
MSVLDTLKSLIGGAKKDIDKNLPEEAESVEETADSIQTSSEEEIETKSDSETISEEEATDVPIEEVAEAEEEVEAEEAPVEEEAVEEAVEEVPEEEVSLDNDDKLSEDEAPEEEASEENEESDNMTLLKENDIYSMDDIDKEFTQKFVDAGIETVDHCFQCGTCGGGCPSGRRTPYRVRQIVRKCLLGLREEVVSDPALWMCTTCYTCQERCPRSVKIVDIIKMARNEAAKAGYMADAHKATGSYVIKFGHGVPINDKTKDLRKAIGLDELPPTVHAFPEALEEVQKICAACEFDKLIGFNMETGELE